MLTILRTFVGSIVYIRGGGGPIGPYNELKNLHFDNEEYMHMSSKIHEANGYGHDLELAIILL